MPIFVYVLDFGAKEAIASSLAVVGVTSLFGALEHRQEGLIKLRVALVFGVFVMVGAYSGSWLAVFFSGAAQLIIFAMVMLIAAFFMLRGGNPGENGEDDGSPGAYAGQMVLRLAAPGMAVEILTGPVGVGGGFLIVPALVLLAEVPMMAAVGTSLSVIAMNSAAGFAGYLGSVEVRWAVVAAFTALAVGGSFAGTYLARFLSGMALKRAFAVFLVLMAVYVLYENREVLPFG